MKELQIQIIYARKMNLICSFQTFVNERLRDLQADPYVTDVKIVGAHPDYVVISFLLICSENASSEDGYKPP